VDGEEVITEWKASLEGEVVKSAVPQDPATREIDPRTLATTVAPYEAEEGDRRGASEEQ
jgi:hypothetical protein